LLVAEDHPYFNLNDLDRDKIYEQVEKLHFRITKENATVKIKVGDAVGKLPDSRGELYILRNKDIRHVLSTNHKNRPARNNLFPNLKYLLSESKLIMIVADDGKHSTWTKVWYYYLLTINDEDFFLNVYETLDGKYGIFSITDKIRN